MAAHHPKPTQSDSFRDLTALMKAKKPYASVSLPTAEPQLSPATNGSQFSSTIATSRSLLSRSPSSFQAPESIAAFLREEKLASTPDGTRPLSEHREQELYQLNLRIDQDRVDDEDHGQTIRQPPSLPYQDPPLIPDLQPLAHIGPVQPSCPVGSLHPTLPAEKSTQESVVRLTKTVWDSMGADLNMLTTQKRALEAKLARLERDNESLRSAENEFEVQIGKLRYQNEANAGQKASMGRALNMQGVEIKKLQLDTDELAKRLSEAECELKKFKGAAIELEEQVKNITRERDEALIAQISAGDYLAQAQDLADTLAKRERIVTDLRQKHLEEQMKVTDLEDEVEMLKGKTNQGDIDNMKEKLREKTIQSDRLRSQIKLTEQHLRVSQERLLRTASNGELLRGAAHLVVPNPNGKLPNSAIACSECYANSLTCDSDVRCRSCTDRNAKCARWRCSLKHRLGECTLSPCKLPHDSQGWLILQEPRPQW
ncbi:Nn.00g010770.m01.CDS01 [Neocucurbitaria sp. VM-36]